LFFEKQFECHGNERMKKLFLRMIILFFLEHFDFGIMQSRLRYFRALLNLLNE